MNTTVNRLLISAAELRPEQSAFVFLRDGEDDVVSISYGELHRRACGVAEVLRSRRPESARVLLLYPPGIDFLSALFGTLYAGHVAVPAHPPSADRSLRRLEAIASDSDPAFVLTTSDIAARSAGVVASLPALSGLEWVSTDILGTGDDRVCARGDSAELAVLQYTSGSTGTPRGVMCTHANVLHNAAYVHQAYSVTDETVSVTWMPHFHDMGLMLGLVQPLYAGVLGVFMPPAPFVQKPLRLLRAISRYRGSFAGGPNFCYDLCVRRISEEDRDSLDLRSWVCAYNGAEPVRRDTLERFSAYFAPAGFRSRAFYPAYGLGEATAHVCGGSIEEEPVFLDVRGDALEQNAAVNAARDTPLVRHLVGCGRAGADTTIVVVDPVTLTECGDRQVGEIWIQNGSVARGYWRRENDTAATFHGYLNGRGPFLRSGDLGFLDRGEMFVTGRLKDLLIVRGANHYPQDIELTVDSSHPAVRPGFSAAFPIEIDGEEKVVVLAETIRERLEGIERDEVFDAIRRRVVEEHELDLYAIGILERGSIFKTSSGKIERKACRRAFEQGELRLVAEWRRPSNPHARASRGGGHRAVRDIEVWLTNRIAERLGIAPARVDTRKTFAEHGLGSADAVALSGEFQEWYGAAVPTTFFYEHPSIHLAARHLADPASLPRATTVDAVAGSDAIAVIGFGCRFPGGATDAESFWSLLAGGVDAISEVPAERWNPEALFDPAPSVAGRIRTRFGGFLTDIDRFDASFFEIAPREADSMDPQQRLLLEVAYEALEDGGQVPDALAGSDTGVFVGICNSDYGQLLRSRPRDEIDAYMSTGTSFAVAGGRISYVFGLEGPNVAVDTACSASLVAVHLACQSLKSGESSLAIAGGVNVILTPELSINFSLANMLAPDGRCKPFDASADGYVRSEGCGLVVLKRLSRAVADGDRILGIIHGSAISQDGRSNGLTAPNGRAQQRVIRRALRAASIDAAEVSYIEAHGSGTPLGDSIELETLKAVFGSSGDRGSACLVGSVKSNLGHLESAAGIAGLIKVLLAFEQETIAPQLHFRRLNPHVSLDGTRLRIATEPVAWNRSVRRRIAGVSSFGLSGTNAHIVLEEPPAREVRQQLEPQRVHVLPISARDEHALAARAAHLADSIERHRSDSGWLDDAIATAAVRRGHHAYRAAVAAESAVDLARGLASIARNDRAPGVAVGTVSRVARPLVFVYSGHGAQWAGMGRQLFAEDGAFAERLRTVDKVLRDPAGFSVLEMLAAPPNDPRFRREDIVQPLLFAMQLALTAQWQAWGVEPDAVMGHSLGEITASVIAGALSLVDGAKIVALRGRLVLPTCGFGRVALVDMSPDDIKVELAKWPEVSIASYHGPGTVLVSGASDAVVGLVDSLQARGVFSRVVDIDYASHSSHMDRILDDLGHGLAGVMGQVARNAMLCSTVTGDVITGEELNGDYWVRNLREPARLHDSVEKLVSFGHEVFLEVSPHPVLTPTLQRTLAGRGEALWSIRRDRDEVREFAESLARVYAAGVDVDWSKRHASAPVVRLPTYPWQRQRYWIAPAVRAQRTSSGHAWLDSAFANAREPGTRVYQGELATDRLPELAAHRIDGTAVAAGALWLEAALHVARLRGRAASLRDVAFTSLLPLDETPRTVQLIADETGFEVLSAPAAESAAWTQHACGRWADGDTLGTGESSLAAARATCRRSVPSSQLYERLRAGGIEHGSRWAAVRNVWLGDGEALTEIALDPASARWGIEPWILDAAIHALTFARDQTDDRTLVLVAVGSLALRCRPTSALWVHCEWRHHAESIGARVRAYDAEGALCFEMDDVHLAALERKQRAPALFEIEWTRERLTSRSKVPGGTWLVVGGGALAAGMCRRLESAGSRPVIVERDADLQPILERHVDCNGVLHVRAAEDDEPNSSGGMMEAQTRGALSVHALVRALLHAGRTPRVWLVTRGTQAVSAAESVRVAHATVWGLARTLEHEHPELSPVCIDLPEDVDAKTLDALAAELAGDGAQRHVAFRDGERFVARLVRRSAAGSQRLPRASRDDVYLITGGLGSLGLAIADALVDGGARRLVLLGRSAPGPVAEAALTALANRGAEVKIVRCDVAAFEELASVVASLGASLKGVVHAAGVLEDRTLLNSDVEAFETVFAPKIAGTWNLHRATEHVSLDFFVLVSSAAAILGSAGQGNYSAANAFLDAVAYHRRRAGRPALSIDFGPFRDIGVASRRSDRGDRLARTGLLGLSASEGVDILAQCLAGDATQVIVLRIDPMRWVESYPRLAEQPYFRALCDGIDADSTAAGRGNLRRELLQLDPRVRLDRLQRHLCAELARVLRQDAAAVRPWTPFGDFGLDSIMGLELRNRLESALDVRLPATMMWTHRTVEALATHLADEMGLEMGLSVRAELPEDDATRDASLPGGSVDGISEEEATAALTAKLDALDL